MKNYKEESEKYLNSFEHKVLDTFIGYMAWVNTILFATLFLILATLNNKPFWYSIIVFIIPFYFALVGILIERFYFRE